MQNTENKNITYNKFIHETLNTLIDLQPKKENLETATGRALKVIFGLEEKKKTENNAKEKKVREESSQPDKSDSTKSMLEEQIEEKGSEELSLKKTVKELVSEKPNERETVAQSQTSNDKQEQFDTVLLKYISKYTDLETRIAYLKRFASPELLQSVEEDLRKKEREQDLNIAAAIVEEKEEMMERNSELSQQKQDNEEPLDQDLFDEADLAKIADDFNHEKDDPIEYFTRVVREVMTKEDPREINSLINLIKDFKKLIAEPDKKHHDNDKKETQHSNKLIRHLHKKYIDSTPQEQKELLKQLNNIQTKLELQRNKGQSKQRHTDQQIANKNIGLAR